MTGDDRPDVRPEDALEVAQRALAKIGALEEDIEQLQSDRDELRDRVVSVELRVSEFDDDRDYTDLSRDDKIGRVRQFAFERAADGRGRSVDYSNVQEHFEDGSVTPSRDHCYDLMRWAAHAEGFQFQEPTSANNRLVVDPDVARRSWEMLSATTRQVEGAR